jgi:hypothetical protein
MFNTNNVNIAGAGMRIITGQSLLEITATEPGTFYLRGYSMQRFDGRAWYRRRVQNHPDDEAARGMPAYIAYAYTSLMRDPQDIPPHVEMNFNRTGDITDIEYSPYYSGVYSRATLYDSGFFYIQETVHGLIEEMTARGFGITGNSRSLLQNYNERLMDTGIYTEINGNTAQGLRQLAIRAGIDPAAGRVEIVDAVAEYIRSSASYTLVPGIVPRDEDFSLYFLQTLREGYCIHFATAAVLMLRALDIPARFTVGYTITVPEYRVGQTVVVTDRNAHAWAEVYYEDVGWLYLEVTPASAASAIPPARAHAPVASTEETQAPQPVEIQDDEDPLPDIAAPGETEQQQPGLSLEVNSHQIQTIPTWAYSAAIFFVCIVLCVVALLLHKHINRKLRAERFWQSNTNEAVICIWKYIIKLHRRRTPPAEDIEKLALKARFSQHRITAAEHASMIKYSEDLAEGIYKEKNIIGRFWLKYIRGL